MKRVFALLLVLCMVAVMLPFAAFAADGDPYVQVRFDHGGAKTWVNKLYSGDAAKYVVTAEDGALSTGSEDNWNIKFEYPDENGAILTLKGATLKHAAADDFTCMVSGTGNVTIKVEQDSSITSKKRTALYFSMGEASTVTITGPGKLSVLNDAAADEDGVQGDGAGITFNSTKTFDCGQLIFKDANVEIKPNATSTTRYAIAFTSRKALVIDNTKLNIVCGEKCLGISGRARVTETQIATYWASQGEDIERDIVIQNGSVVTGSSTSREFLATTGKIMIKNSTLDANAGKASANKVFDRKPILEGEYTAAGGSSAEKMVEYNESKATTYKVVKIVPGTVDLGTLGVVTVPTTAPTEAPETEPTTEATVPVENTEATVPETTVGTNNDAGNEVETTEAADVDTDAVEEEGGLPGVVIALVIVAGVLVLAIAAFAILWFVVKPKWLMGLLKR